MKIIFQLSQDSLKISKTLDGAEFEPILSIECELGSGIFEAQKIKFENDSDTKPIVKKRLDLADRIDMNLESIWKLIYPKYVSKSTELKLNIIDRASFTDTRLLAIWLRSEVFFDPTKVFRIFKDGILQDSSDIAYLREPNIN
jgi:hypothetical protein